MQFYSVTITGLFQNGLIDSLYPLLSLSHYVYIYIYIYIYIYLYILLRRYFYFSQNVTSKGLKVTLLVKGYLIEHVSLGFNIYHLRLQCSKWDTL